MLYFFFQAEDGIRDYKVTGVQTCALPILAGEQLADQRCHLRGVALGIERRDLERGEMTLQAFGRALDPIGNAMLPGCQISRSEERRVGKECRSRWSPYH